MMETPIPAAWSRETIIDYERRFVSVIDKLGHGNETNKFVAQVFGKAKDNRIASTIIHLDFAHNAQSILKVGQKAKFNLQALKTDRDLRQLVTETAETIALDEGLTDDNSFWPQNEQEWKDFMTLALPVLGELFISLTPIGDVKDVVDAFNGGTTTQKATAITFLLISLTPADTIKDAVKGVRIVRKAIVVLHKLRKFRKVAARALKSGFKTTIDAAGNLIIKKGGEIVAKGDAAVKKFLGIVDTPKNLRPDPSEYLDPSYIAKHLAKFKDGASRIVSKTTFQRRGIGKPDAGKTEFVATKTDIDEILKLPVEKQAEKLGIPVEQIKNDGLVRVDFKPSSKIEMPSGKEFGANDQWIPGGVTSGGVDEAIVKTEGMKEGVDYIVKNL